MIDWEVREMHLSPRADDSWDGEVSARSPGEAAEDFARETFEEEIREDGTLDFSRTLEVRKLSLNNRKTKIHRVTVTASFEIDWLSEVQR